MYHINIISKPRVSIITVVLNGVETIENTINSVISQTFTDIEYIIIDGGSTDGTVEVIKKYKSYLSTFISEPDNGISDAFNKGILAATGEIIGLIDSDDWLEKSAVEDIVNVYGKYPFYDVYYGNCNIIDYNSRSNLFLPINRHIGLLETMSIAHPATFVKRISYIKYGLYNEDYQIAMNYEWLLKSYLNGALFLYVNKHLANHSPGGISQVNYKESYAECIMARRIHLGK
jgi:glycosyltransferase involved in cell wall biosynthesis